MNYIINQKFQSRNDENVEFQLWLHLMMCEHYVVKLDDIIS